MTNELGRRLREERHRRNEPEADAAVFFGISQASYHRWESGQHEPKPARYNELARYLGMTVADVNALLRGETTTTLDELRATVADLQRDVIELRGVLRAVRNEQKKASAPSK